jgi:precorrin isomerase
LVRDIPCSYFRSNWQNWNFALPDAASASAAAADAAAALRNVATVLVDSSVVVAGIRIHGSPWVETYASNPLLIVFL